MSASPTTASPPLTAPSASPSAPLIELRDVDYAYSNSDPSSPRRLALSNVSLTVQQGTTLGVIGPNGGGKTTLIKLLLGSITPDRGSVTVAGLPATKAAAAGNILGYVPQTSSAATPAASRLPVTVSEAVRMGLIGKTGLLNTYSKPDLAFADSLMHRTGIHPLRHRLVSTLSGGELQRMLITRALVSRPRVLLMDEPTTGIDRAGQQHFIEFVIGLKSEFDLTLLMVSHDLRAIASVSDRIACLNVTLHYHDVPQHLPPDLVYKLFACDLEAMGLDGKHTPGHVSLPPVADVPLTIGGR